MQNPTSVQANIQQTLIADNTKTVVDQPEIINNTNSMSTVGTLDGKATSDVNAGMESLNKKAADNADKALQAQNPKILTKKELPLPDGWVIKSGDLDLLDRRNNTYIVFEKKKLEDAAKDLKKANEGVASEVQASHSAVVPDSKEKGDQANPLLLSHVVIGNVEMLSKNDFSGIYEKTKVNATCIILVFENGNPSLVNLLSNSIIDKTSPELTALRSVVTLNPQVMGLPSISEKNPVTHFAISFYRERTVLAFFNHLIDKGILSKQEAQYYKEICGHKTIPATELEKVTQINKAIKDAAYKRAVELVQEIHADAIKENQEQNVFWGDTEGVGNALYFDDADAAFEIGKQLLPLSLHHAAQCFALLKENNPLNDHRCQIAYNYCLKAKENVMALSSATRSNVISFLMDSINADTNIDIDPTEALNLFFELLEMHAGFNSADPKNRLFKSLKNAADLMELVPGNIIAAANKLFEISKARDDKASQKTAEESTVTAQVKQAESESSAAKIDHEKTKVEAAITAIDNSTIPHAKLAVSSDATATAANSIDIKSQSDINTLQISQDNAAENYPLPKNWELVAGDWKKLEKDNQEWITFKRQEASKTAVEQDSNLNVKAADEKEKGDAQQLSVIANHAADSKARQEPIHTLDFVCSNVIIIRLKYCIYDEKTGQRKVIANPVFSLILLSPDKRMQPYSSSVFNYDVLVKQDPIFSHFLAYNAGPRFLVDANHFKMISSISTEMGMRILAFEVGDMREELRDNLFDAFFRNGILREEEINYLKKVLQPKAPSQEELAEMAIIQSHVTKAWELHASIQKEKAKKQTKETEVAIDLLNAAMANSHG